MKVVDNDKKMLESVKRRVTEEPSLIYEKKESPVREKGDEVDSAIAALMG